MEKLQCVLKTLAGKAVSEQIAKKDQGEKGLGVRKSGVSGAGRSSGLKQVEPGSESHGTEHNTVGSA